MRKIELNGRGWWRGSQQLNYEPTVINDDALEMPHILGINVSNKLLTIILSCLLRTPAALRFVSYLRYLYTSSQAFYEKPVGS